MQDLAEEDATLVTGMLQPVRLQQLQEFLKRPDSLSSLGDDPSLPSGSLRALSTQDMSFRNLSFNDKARTLSLMPPAAAAAILGRLGLLQPTADHCIAVLACCASASCSDLNCLTILQPHAITFCWTPHLLRQTVHSCMPCWLNASCSAHFHTGNSICY